MSRKIDTSFLLVSQYKLQTFFRDGCVEHHCTVSDRARGVREYTEIKKWHRLKQLGRGGFGDVYLERDTSGELRAVKEIRKQTADTSQKIDWFQEVVAMAYTSKAGQNSLCICIEAYRVA